MCTGDNVETARSICEKAGIIVDAKDETDPEIIEKLKDPMFVENRKKYECMTGEEFRKEFGRKTEDDLWEANPRAFHWKTMIIPHLKCLARSSPTDKQILVQGIQNYSEIKAIVAVTGDGTNDCPALKRADVGFAMMTGSDAAKTASKVILTTDDFNSTLVCVKFGRNIYDSVQKFLQFQLTVNVVAIFIVLLGAVVLNEKVLTSVQILWVNLIMDTFAALALATEPATESLLDRAPTRAEESIVSNVMARNILGWSVYQIATLCIVLFTGQEMFDLKFRAEDPFYWNCEQTFCEERIENNAFTGVDDPTQVIDLATGVVGVAHAQTDKVMMYTMIFNLFVWLQVFNQFNARKIADKSWNVFSGLTSNCWFVGITFVTILTQIAVVQWLGRPLRTTPLTWEQQLYTIGLSAGIIPWNLIQTALLKKEWFGWASDCVPNEEANEEEEGEQSAVIALSGRASTRMAAALKKKVQQAVE
jgi:magnesium-transporting ATPase (P-type)